MKDILEKMMHGWIAHEASWDDKEHSRSEDDCMIEACGGNVVEGTLIKLFDHWANDIQSLAPHYGISLERDAAGKLYILRDIPPAPSPGHWWHEGKWIVPIDDVLEEGKS